jgi:hypothetical protein
MKEKVYQYLVEQKAVYDAGGVTEYHSPTSIGLALGLKYNNASGTVNYPLKALLKEGKIIKNQNKHYKAK